MPINILPYAHYAACMLSKMPIDRENKRKAVKRSDRQRKQELKTKSDLMKDAQLEFNKFIRLRDAKEPCISCQRYHQGQMHAGHYISTGAATELRFEGDNCNSQCAPCNNHLSGNPIKYRINLIKKIGLKRVEWLEGPHPMPNWTRDELIQIKLDYRKKCREMV